MFLCSHALFIVLGQGLHAAGVAAVRDDAEIGARLANARGSTWAFFAASSTKLAGLNKACALTTSWLFIRLSGLRRRIWNCRSGEMVE